MKPAASAGYTRYGIYRSGLSGEGLSLRRTADGRTVLVPAEAAPKPAPVSPPTAEGAATEKPTAPRSLPGETDTAPVASGSSAIEKPPAGPFFPTPVPGFPSPYPRSKPGSRAAGPVFPPTPEMAPGALPFGPTPRELFAPPGSPFGGGFGLTGSAPVTITALNDSTFVVANPAAGPNGEPAVMLTVYRLQGAELRIVSKALHRLDSGEGRRRFGTNAPGGPDFELAPPGRRGGLPTDPRPGTRSSTAPAVPSAQPAAPAASSTNGVPVLSDLPILGALFRSGEKSGPAASSGSSSPAPRDR
jgi:hypothetical protein